MSGSDPAYARGEQLLTKAEVEIVGSWDSEPFEVKCKSSAKRPW
ncbi:hypothetical protein CBOVI_03620 [Corynebacterium bovis DSM 20582 = CIP 54.80]|uniref:Uncharacterized protein n=1 Tax=Corynebacterium bovis DSM 20582 = CIP 54.80 TaxID=927655 RepID=A0A8H9Y8X3_9CORY|nr:hypothetical protein [Corynebacterium bovis DSM 20582 = CIP 54.80]WJY77258.1 hypothetical protein CBOVI_03620 [Corynebacterium bovis DSM 20582 = CIP 54.80]